MPLPPNQKDYYSYPEVTAPNFAAVESNMPKLFGDKEFQANYRKMSELIESGHREVFTIVD